MTGVSNQESLQSVRGVWSGSTMTEQRYSTNGRLIKPHEEKIFAKEWQREILLERFEVNPYPSREVCMELEKIIKLDTKWIRNWYQYMRKRRNIRQETFFVPRKPGPQFIIDGEPELQEFASSEAAQGANVENASSSKKYFKPKVFSQPWQRDILLEYYSRTPYPTQEDVAEIERKIKLDSVWIKGWFHTKRQKEKTNQISYNVKPAGGKVTLSEDTETEESPEKLTETAAPAPEKNSLVCELRQKFDKLQAQYNVLYNELRQRSVISEDRNYISHPPKPPVPTVDLTESSSEASMPPVHQYPQPPVPFHPAGYPYPHYYPHYFPPQYPPQYPQPQYYPQPPARAPGSLPYPPAPQ